MALKVSRAAPGREESRALEVSQERRANWEKSGWMVLTVKMEIKDCLVLLERKGILGEGVTKVLKETEEKEETLESEVTRVTRDGTASSEDPKEKRETSAPWVSPGAMDYLEVLESPGRTVALAEGGQQELRATGAAQASRALRESQGPEAHRVQLVPPALQASSVNKAFPGPREAEGRQVLLENVADSVPWEERVSLENQDQRAELGTGAPVVRRETTGGMDLAAKDAKARKENEDSLDTQVQRAPLASRGPVEL